MADVAKRIANLSPEKRALLEARLLQQRAPSGAGVIPRRRPGEPVPLSFSQQRLWFLDQWQPGSPTYNAALPMRIRGPLDVGALERALNRVVERHEATRTVFRMDAAGPVQVVLDDWSLELPLVDLRDLAPAARELELTRLLREHARRPFDLARDLMLRVTLFRLAPDEHVLHFQEHHIAFDGWSDGVMFAELEQLYAEECGLRPAVLADLPIQYADFTVWQQDRLQGTMLDEHVAYWRRQLAGAPARLPLPTDRPRPAVQTFEGVHHPIALPGSLADDVRRLSQSESATPFMTLLAAFVGLLYRWCGADDIVVGTPIANRGRVELEPLIGFFSNTLVLRTRLNGNPTFRALIARVREAALEAYVHQDLPFEKVVDAVRPTRDPSSNPLFQVNFRVQTGEAGGLSLDGLDVAPVELDVGFSRFDLALELQLGSEGIGGYIEYNLDLFEPRTIARLAAELETLLTEALADPDLPILSLRVFADRDEAPHPHRRPTMKSFRDKPQAGSAAGAPIDR
jgi:hypothetical protein